MLRAEVGRQGRLDVVPGILFSAIIWKLRQQSRQVVGPMQRLCGVCGVLALPLSLCNYASSRTFWAVEHIGHSTFLPLTLMILMLLFQICYSQPEHRHLPLAQGKVGEEPGPKRTGVNLDEGRVWGPKTEPRIWHPRSVPPLLPASVSVPFKVPKMGPQNRPLAQPWCAKCPRLTDPHLG